VTWSYDITQLATSPLMQLRWLIGDTLVKDPQLQDEELAFALSQRTSIYGAAADSCRALSARLSREADSTQGPLHALYSSRARAYAARAGDLEVRAMARSGGLPYSGMVSKADYEQMEQDPDRIAPQFGIDMEDNRLPVGGVGPETID
jgi:hypothetical protein